MGLIERLKRYVEIDSTFPNEKELGLVLKKELEELGFECKKDEGKRFNIFAKRGNPKVMFLAHIDTVPVPKGMHKPFKLEVEGNIGRGLGVYDMKGGIAAIMELAERSKEDMAVLFTFDEENISLGSWKAMNYDYRGIEFAISPEIMDCEDYREGDVIVARRGRVVLELNIESESTHGANPKKESALELGLDVCNKIKHVETKKHRYFSSHFFIRAFHSEARALMLPENAHIEIDYHMVPGETIESVLETFRKIDEGFKIKERKTPYMLPYDYSESHYLEKIRKIIVEEYGRFEKKGGLTVADENRIGQIMPVFTIGPVGGNAHQKDEWVDIKSLEKLLKVYEKILEEHR